MLQLCFDSDVDKTSVTYKYASGLKPSLHLLEGYLKQMFECMMLQLCFDSDVDETVTLSQVQFVFNCMYIYIHHCMHKLWTTYFNHNHACAPVTSVLYTVVGHATSGYL